MSDAKIRGCLIGAIVAIYSCFVLVGLARYVDQQDRQSIDAQRGSEPANGTTVQKSAFNVVANSFPQEHPCNKTQEDGYSDRCQQWRMAEAAEQLTWLTTNQIIITGVEVGLLILVLVYTARATYANTEGNRLTRQSFVAEQRPWMALEGIEKASPLVWKDEEGKITFRFVFKNYGNSPAIQVDVHTEIIAKFATLHTDIFDEFSRRNRSKTYNFGGATVFPGKIFKATQGISIPKKEIDQYFADAAAIGQGEWRHVTMVLAGSIQYKTTLDDEFRFTEFVFMLFRDDGEGPRMIAPDDGEVPIKEIVLKHWPVRNDMIT